MMQFLADKPAVADIACGAGHTLALLDTGQARSWVYIFKISNTPTRMKIFQPSTGVAARVTKYSFPNDP